MRQFKDKIAVVIWLSSVLGAGLWLSAGSLAYARPQDDGSGSRHHYGKMEEQCSSQCPVAQKFMRKAHFLLEHKSDLGLTDEQVKAVKELTLQADKDQIRQNAESKIFQLDLKSKMDDEKIDVEGTNALIDKGFSAYAAATKANLDAYVKLKALLTPDQITKIKELHMKDKAEWKNKGDGSRT
jgi:hypothetical protein